MLCFSKAVVIVHYMSVLISNMSEEQTGVTKKSFGDNNGHSTKRLKLSENARASFEGAYDVSVLNEKRTQKAVFLQGKFPENPEADAVIILEQKPFDVSPKALSGLLSVETELSVDMNNDIYSTYNAIPARGICGLKATLIYPASKKHINKYKKQDIFAITETGEDYQQITLPYLEKQFSNNVFNIQWVYNILDHRVAYSVYDVSVTTKLIPAVVLAAEFSSGFMLFSFL